MIQAVLRAWAIINLLLAAPNPHLEKGRSLVAGYREDDALKVLEKAIAWPQNSPTQLAEAYWLTGLAWASKADERRAIEGFRAALVLDPSLRLPDDASPRVREWVARAMPTSGVPAPTAEEPRVEVVPTPVSPAVVEPSPPAVVVLPPTAPPRPVAALRWSAVAGFVVSAALVSIAVTQGVLANGRLEQSKTLSGAVEAQQAHSEAVAAAQRANWLYVFGGLSAGVASLLLVLSF